MWTLLCAQYHHFAYRNLDIINVILSLSCINYTVSGNYSHNYSLKSFWVWCYKVDTPIFGQFLLSSAQPFSHISRAGLWLGHSRTFTDCSLRHSFVILAWLSWFIVLLENEPSPQSDPAHSGAGHHQGRLYEILHSSFICISSWLVSHIKTSSHHDAATTMLRSRDDYYEKLRPISSQCDTWYWGYRVQSLFHHTRNFVSHCLRVC